MYDKIFKKFLLPFDKWGALTKAGKQISDEHYDIWGDHLKSVMGNPAMTFPIKKRKIT